MVLTYTASVTEPGALAQSAPDQSTSSSSVGPAISLLLQSRARTTLERHLKPEEFQIFVTAIPAKNRAQPLPYLPESLEAIPTPDDPSESFAPWLSRIDVEILIADRYGKDAKAKLENMVRKSLAMDPARGDTVKFSSIGLKFDPPVSELQREVVRAEADARDLRSKIETLGRERDDVKKELSQTKVELDRIAREKAAVDNGKKGEKKADDPASDATKSADEPFWRENLGVLVGSLLALIGITVANLAIRSAAKTLGAAVQSIGTSIPQLGDKLGDSFSQKSQLLLPPADSNRGSPQNRIGEAHNDEARAVALPMDLVAKRVIELHEELVLAVNVDTESIVLEYLNFLLEDDKSVSRAVATMELLGKNKANELYKFLPPDHQQKVAVFLSSGFHSKPKGEVMIEAGDALKSKLFGADLPSRIKLDDGIQYKLMQLKPDDLVNVAKGLDGDYLARLFAYIEPKKLAPVLKGLHRSDPIKFKMAAKLVSRIPDVEASTNLDSELDALIVGQIAKSSADIHLPYLNYYKTLIESIDDEVAEFLSEELSASNPRIDRYIRESVITFATFFKLSGDIQEEIVVGMSNKDLAALVVSIAEEYQKIIYQHVEEKRRELVEEEVKRIAAKGIRQVQVVHRAAKGQVVAKITQMKGAGSLTDMLEQKSDAVAVVPQNSSEAA